VIVNTFCKYFLQFLLNYGGIDGIIYNVIIYHTFREAEYIVRSISYSLPKASYISHRRSRYIAIIENDIQNAEQRCSLSLTPPFGLRREGGRDVPICINKIMRISLKSLCRRKIFSTYPQEVRNRYMALRALRALGVKERVLAFGKLQLLLLGSRLHFPSENRQSCTSLKGRFYSFQTVDGASSV